MISFESTKHTWTLYPDHTKQLKNDPQVSPPPLLPSLACFYLSFCLQRILFLLYLFFILSLLHIFLIFSLRVFFYFLFLWKLSTFVSYYFLTHSKAWFKTWKICLVVNGCIKWEERPPKDSVIKKHIHNFIHIQIFRSFVSWPFLLLLLLRSYCLRNFEYQKNAENNTEKMQRMG